MKTRINLLPWRQALAERRRKYLLAGLLAFACAALAAVWLADQVIDQAIDRQVTRNDHLGKEINGLDSRIRTIDDLQERSQQLAQRMKVVQDLHDSRSSGAQLLDQLARAVPDGVHLHEVVAKGDTVSISGSGISCSSKSWTARLQPANRQPPMVRRLKKRLCGVSRPAILQQAGTRENRRPC